MKIETLTENSYRFFLLTKSISKHLLGSRKKATFQYNNITSVIPIIL